MSDPIFKYINGKFVISEGYGSVKKNKKDVEEARGLGVPLGRGAANAMARSQLSRGQQATMAPTGQFANELPPIKDEPEIKPALETPPTPAPATSTKVVEPRDKGKTPMEPISGEETGAGVTSASSREIANREADLARKETETATTDAAETTEEPAEAGPQDLTTFVGFAKAAGISDPAKIEELVSKVTSWASKKNIALDQNKLKAGIESAPVAAAEPSAAPVAEPAVAAESKYFYPRVQKSFIRHPSLVGYGYRR